MWILSNQTLRSSEAMSQMPSNDGGGHLLRLSVMVLLISLLLALSSCAFLQTTSDVLDRVQQVLGARNAQLKIEHNGDSLTVIRTYPGTVVNLHANVDSTYRLNSGDLLTVRWLGQSKAILVAEIVPDTIRVKR